MALPESFIRAFSDTFLTDDIGGFMKLIDQDCEWVLMATGETFRGTGEVRQLAERSVAARRHTKDDHIEFTNLFTSEDQMCLEYIHRAIVTEQWPSSSNRPPCRDKGGYQDLPGVPCEGWQVRPGTRVLRSRAGGVTGDRTSIVFLSRVSSKKRSVRARSWSPLARRPAHMKPGVTQAVFARL